MTEPEPIVAVETRNDQGGVDYEIVIDEETVTVDRAN